MSSTCCKESEFFIISNFLQHGTKNNDSDREQFYYILVIFQVIKAFLSWQKKKFLFYISKGLEYLVSRQGNNRTGYFRPFKAFYIAENQANRDVLSIWHLFDSRQGNNSQLDAIILYSHFTFDPAFFQLSPRQQQLLDCNHNCSQKRKKIGKAWTL